ncbi:MFS transporter [Neobacillus mesonae]|nr:MFS transporter [Neobacillus mesonae]
MLQRPSSDPQATIFPILIAIGLVHLLNDSVQSVIPAIFPVLQDNMGISYSQMGWIAFALNITASIMQPVVGYFSDRRPTPALLPIGMAFTCSGMIFLAFADSYLAILLAVIMVGLGSAAFHPEGSKVSHMAAGNRRGLAQSIFQVGGNAGQSLAPLLTRWVFIPFGLMGSLGFAALAAVGIAVQIYIARWYGRTLRSAGYAKKKANAGVMNPAVKNKIVYAFVVLVLLVFVRSWYISSIGSYYAFFLKDAFALSTEDAQLFIFLFLGAGALGTFFGGPLADRYGKRNVILSSMALASPLALILPYANLFWTGVLLTIIGFIMLSSFSVTVVYAQMLVPGKIGTVSGMITGLAFGLGGLGSLVLGNWIDAAGISTVMFVCSFMPLLGVLTFLLPTDKKLATWTDRTA